MPIFFTPSQKGGIFAPFGNVVRRKGLKIALLIGIFGSIGGVTYKVVEHFSLMKARQIRNNPLRILDYVPEATLKIKDFRQAGVERGRKVWEVAGEEANYLKAEKEAFLKKPRFVYYHENGGSVEAKANEGHLFLTDQEMEKLQLLGAIEIKYQGFVAQMDEIVYLKSTNQALTPGKVILKGEGLELEGVGMELSLEDQKFRILENVKTKLYPDRWGKKDGKPNGKKRL